MVEDRDEETSDSWVLKIEIRKNKRERKFDRKAVQEMPSDDFSDDYEVPKTKID